LPSFFLLLTCSFLPQAASAGMTDAAWEAYENKEYARAYKIATILVEELNDPDAYYLIGLMSIRGRGTPKDYRAAASAYQSAAFQGHAEAQYAFSYMYSKGLGVPLSQKSQRYWAYQAASRENPDGLKSLKKMAQNGDTTALVGLGMALNPPPNLNEEYSPSGGNHEEAAYWFKKAAKQGFPPGQVCYAMSQCENPQIQIKWLTQAANQGDIEAQCALATLYREGTRFERDLAKANRYARQAATHGHPLCQYRMFTLYKDGQDGISQNDKLANKWLTLAAMKGYSNAQGLLGARYFSGIGVPSDKAEAYKWILLESSQSGRPGSEGVLREMESRMTQAQIDEGTKRAKPLMNISYSPHHACYVKTLWEIPKVWK